MKVYYRIIEENLVHSFKMYLYSLQAKMYKNLYMKASQ